MSADTTGKQDGPEIFEAETETLASETETFVQMSEMRPRPRSFLSKTRPRRDLGHVSRQSQDIRDLQDPLTIGKVLLLIM